MKLLNFAFGVSLFTNSVLSHPYDFGFTTFEDEMETIERRQSGRIITKGVTGDVQPRLELRQMEQQEPDQFTLLLLGMQKFQALSQGDSTSYFQIAAIHGVPRQDWNGVANCGAACAGADGYCMHDMPTFPPFHRAYMALFEQELVAIVKSIANSWPSSGRASMQDAANKFRCPFWDWAAAPLGGGNNVPDSLASPQIVVNGPNGQQTIQNPLYSHHFTDEKGLVYSPFVTWPNTLRYPTSTAPSAGSNEGALVSAFNRIRGSFQDQVYKLLTGCDDYLHFSNDDAGSSSPSCGNSVEGIHNAVHTTAGGPPTSSVPSSGHMYYLSTAGFDPMFFFHHCNVDRLFALWQALHPDSYGASAVAPQSTWTTPAGSKVDANSPLKPFYKSGNTFWTTNSVRDWTVFGYTYPEFQNGGSKSQIAKAVNALYGPGAGQGSSKRDIFSFPMGALAQNGSAYEYIANIQAPRYALNGTYQILLFLGAPATEDPASWFNDDSLVGPMGVFAQPGMTMNPVTISGSIPLTRALTEKLGSGIIAELTESLVGPFLQNVLQWRVLGADGQSVDPDSIPDFLVSVYSTTATNPGDDDSLPEYSQYVPMPIATHGKKGGLLGLSGLGDLGGLIGIGKE